VNIAHENRQLRLPDFLIVGAAKSGTSSLYQHLEAHPEIFMTRPKEPNFFAFDSQPELYDARRALFQKINMHRFSAQDYLALFRDAGPGQKCGEASTYYFDVPEASIRGITTWYRERALELKILAMLRDPAEKVFSHYLMFRQWGVEHRSFAQAIGLERPGEATEAESMIDYVDQGFLYERVKAYKDHFRNCWVHLLEDLNAPAELVQSAFRFLEVDSTFVPPNIGSRYNVGGVAVNEGAARAVSLLESRSALKRALKPLLPAGLRRAAKRRSVSFIKRKWYARERIGDAEKKHLREVYRNDTTRLQELIGRDLSAWLD
jgi:hypothetical protein